MQNIKNLNTLRTNNLSYKKLQHTKPASKKLHTFTEYLDKLHLNSLYIQFSLKISYNKEAY